MNKVYDFPPKPIIFDNIGEIVFPSLANEYIDENSDILFANKEFKAGQISTILIIRKNEKNFTVPSSVLRELMRDTNNEILLNPRILVGTTIACFGVH